MRYLLFLNIFFAIGFVNYSFADTKQLRKPASFPGPLELSGNENLGPCESTGIVVVTTTLFRLNNQGRMVFDEVKINQSAFICAEEADYYGIIFGSPKQDCKIPKPINKKEEYKGPCRSGWIKKGFFENL